MSDFNDDFLATEISRLINERDRYRHELEQARIEIEAYESYVGPGGKKYEEVRTRLDELEDAMTWGTSCLNCSSLLEKNYRQFVALEKVRDLHQPSQENVTAICAECVEKWPCATHEAIKEADS